MTFTLICQWIWRALQWAWCNRVSIANRLTSLFWVVYSVVLPYFGNADTLPEPWNKIVPATAAVLTFYGFGNSTMVHAAKSGMSRMFKRTS
jgi:hypothetical protein